MAQGTTADYGGYGENITAAPEGRKSKTFPVNPPISIDQT